RAHLASGHDAMRDGRHLFGVDLLRWVIAAEASRRGDQDAAFVELRDLWQQTTTMRGLTQFRSIGPDLVRAALATGHPTVAVAVVTEVEDIAARTSIASLTASARRCRALLEGDGPRLLAAATLLDTTPWRLDQARARAEAAELL